MLNVPSSMQPTLDRWNKTTSLGDGMKFGNSGTGASYAELMDTVVKSDNGDNDANSAAGLLVAKDDGETIRFQGDSKSGSMEACCADGRVVAAKFSETSVDYLQLTPKPEGGVEALHEHFDRSGGPGWMQLGGAVTVINMDEPGALDGIFGLKASQSAPAISPENAAKAEQIGQNLAERLQVSADAVQLSSFESKGFNASNCDFAVNGEMQMSAFTQGIELKFNHDGQGFVYRGLDEKTGRFGQDVAHEGYWKLDERGIYIPDNSPISNDW